MQIPLAFGAGVILKRNKHSTNDQLCYPKVNFRVENAESHPSNFHQVLSFIEEVAVSCNYYLWYLSVPFLPFPLSIFWLKTL